LKSETALLLTYYYRPEDRDHPILKHIVEPFCGVHLPFDMHYYEPLKRIFGRVLLYDFLRLRAEVGLKAMNEEVLALVRDQRPRYVLWTALQDDIRPSTLTTIRGAGSLVVGWFFDDEWRFHSYSKHWIPYLDYCATNALSAVPKYRQLGARVIHTIPNTGVAVDVDWAHLETKYDITFVGNIGTTDRRRYLDEFRTNNIPVKLFGKASGGYVSYQQMLEIFGTSRINLNFSKTIDERRSFQIKGRPFQVCMAGGFLLTEHAPGLEEYFEVGKEIVCFESPSEMVDKARYYLNHESERRAITRAGWERAKDEYSSSRMVARVFEEIEQDFARGTRVSASPAWMWKPLDARRSFSIYHTTWASAQMEEAYTRGLWRDDLRLALSYDPGYAWAWFYRIVASLPSSTRLSIFRWIRRLEDRFGFPAVAWLDFWPMLKSFVSRMAQSLLGRSESGHRA
jgi:spore maturation protein CgeB